MKTSPSLSAKTFRSDWRPAWTVVFALAMAVVAALAMMPAHAQRSDGSDRAEAAAGPKPATAGIGRLFYTPERRQVLEQQRLSRRPAERQVESRQLSFDGLVQRSSGKRTVWVNGRPLTEHDASVLAVVPRPANPGRARITIPNEGGHELAVGSQVNRETGETRSPLKGGRVQVLSRP